MTTEQDLRAVLELSERATPEEWAVRSDDEIVCLTGPEAWHFDLVAFTKAEGEPQAAADAALIAAAVNLLRKHGSALLRAVEDARRYQWLRGVKPGQAEIFMENDGIDLDAAIDAAIAEGDQA